NMGSNADVPAIRKMTEQFAAVPTLDAIVRNPASAAALSAEDRGALIVQAAAVLAALGGAMTTVRDEDESDALLKVPEVAPLLNLSEDYMYRHAREFPFFVEPPNGARAVRFSKRGLDRYIEERQK